MLSEVEDLSDPIRLELPINDRYRVLQWKEGPVYISYTRKGDAIAMHIAAEGSGKLELRNAANCFCATVFSEFEWCTVIIGLVGKQSVINLAKKCGFSVVREGMRDGEKVALVARERQWDS